MVSEERTRSAVLAGLTVLALAVGAWWWRSAAPVVDPVPAARATVAAEPSPATDPASSSRVWIVDPGTGDASPGPDIGSVMAGGEEVRPDTLWHDGSHVRAGSMVERQTSSTSGARLLLSAACRGPGPLTVSWTGAQEDETQLLVACDGAAVRQPLVAAGGPVTVRFVAGERQLDLDATLAGLY
ncbi:hypothetical protein [Micromonospora maritima]|uniref:hypothetical protein n=1 Tax=Micromonospora maritima TaxID=986711 RepID=UPI00157D31BD|nr:hypothetical protein [Micromonospora maritima]